LKHGLTLLGGLPLATSATAGKEGAEQPSRAEQASQGAARKFKRVLFVNVPRAGAADSWALLHALHRGGPASAPSLGAWICHGLSRSPSCLPAQVVLMP